MRFPLPWRRPASPALPVAADLMLAFESLGDNCEFGLVQRYCGAEPLGLFRFSSVTLAELLHALDTGFREYGAPGDLAILVAEETGRLYCKSRRYGFAYTTSDVVATTAPSAILARETARVAYLKRRLLEDLAEGTRILVRKGPPGEGEEAVATLARAIRRHGPSTLLSVHEAVPGQPSGTVTRRGDGTMVGRLQRFAPYETAYDIALESWLGLCRNAYALAHGLLAPAPAPAPRTLLAKTSRRPARHVLAPNEAGVTVFGARQRTDRLDHEAVHVFSAFVWIPAGFAGDRVGAAIGHFRFGWHDADLSVRDAWQRVWAAARIPGEYRDLMMGLVVSGPAGERLWSADHRLELGPVPAGRPQPRTIPIGPGSGA